MQVWLRQHWRSLTVSLLVTIAIVMFFYPVQGPLAPHFGPSPVIIENAYRVHFVIRNQSNFSAIPVPEQVYILRNGRLAESIINMKNNTETTKLIYAPYMEQDAITIIVDDRVYGPFPLDFQQMQLVANGSEFVYLVVIWL